MILLLIHISLATSQAGGIAGLSADLILFPLDTIKTRLQSSSGFRGSGGFTRLYAGLGSACIGSIPSAAVFFAAYESGKRILPQDTWWSAGASAAVGETIACGIRVPVEVIKQRSQADTGRSSMQHLKITIKSEGGKGLFRGYTVMVMREIPFSFIQFPIWEQLKLLISARTGQPCTKSHAVICGAIAGGIAAFATNPLDVSKTRVMLADKSSQMSGGSVMYALRTVFQENGVKGLFAGVVPRVTWISIGGAIFLGGYETAAQILEQVTR